METNDLYPVHVLDVEECWDLLISSSFGRLALSIAGEPDIYPVNFVAADRRLVFRTAEGTKLLELTVNNKVAFETDGVGRDEAWSVVARGHARVLEHQADIDAADQLPLRPLIPTLKYIYVEIVPETVSGRRFQLGPEPERY
ncbi:MULTISPECIES: pyridoxamine 5'-phosphate oxidase family protein [unclassified Cryobacterium]|uniref:pyridoxamine 5'-phosphate oxidase family protein n=1 Tax=unclassified Cryobacterium TaxID=2649013 RepID=UPI002AB34AB5|nr:MULTISPECIES: pyridoxamine 5'-phosphate oxidase family protein [unclassified Cryobacterium]MDY7543223.1 pyridoxamine 5'-phosphate oxidase family protein [Cryobacterium sp. 5B3]MEA9998377.1 pyridoxamine 5'-phosphate oxidase family protein [Cryobacterium sp. RTS3]MEB0265271.1 pyridoxamine 5'-phosphate oxidase family protein [Cryobacterium sp. 10I5]MEB0274331.1 pyridoxamine 5'-phosphate oxidase family protein [Cryobacterium sp. 5B3]